MEWIDEVAALTAMRHCGGLVTTCAVENLRFKYGAYINEIIVLIGKITYVGKTSMEVRVDTYVEDIETLSEKAEWEGAIRRNAARKQRFSDGY